MTAHPRTTLAFLVTFALAAALIVALQIVDASAAEVCIPPDAGPQQACVILDDDKVGVVHNGRNSPQTAVVLERTCTDEDGVTLTTVINGAASHNFFEVRKSCRGHDGSAIGAIAGASGAAGAPAAGKDAEQAPRPIIEVVEGVRCIATGGDDEVCAGVFLEREYIGATVTQPRADVVRSGALVARDCDGEDQGLDLVVAVNFQTTDLSVPSDELCGDR